MNPDPAPQTLPTFFLRLALLHPVRQLPQGVKEEVSLFLADDLGWVGKEAKGGAQGEGLPGSAFLRKPGPGKLGDTLGLVTQGPVDFMSPLTFVLSAPQPSGDFHTPCPLASLASGLPASCTLSAILIKRLQPSQEASCSLVEMLSHTSRTRLWAPTSSIWAEGWHRTILEQVQLR